MAFDKAYTALYDLEDRLRRLLGLAGAIRPTFDAKAVPVILAGDALSCGYNILSGRRFQGTLIVTSAVAGLAVLRAESSVVVDGYTITCQATNSFQVNLATADAGADPLVVNQQRAVFTEIPGPNSLKAPLMNSAMGAASFIGQTIHLHRITASYLHTAPQPIHLPAGARLLFGTVDATGTGTAAFVSFWGHVL